MVEVDAFGRHRELVAISERHDGTLLTRKSTDDARTMLQPLLMKPPTSARLHEFFLSTTEQCFHESGRGRIRVGYVAAVPTEFARSDRLYAVRTARGRTIGVSDLRRTTAPMPCARAPPKYVGDYTLFMTGLFRTHVESRGALGSRRRGQRSYRAVSAFDLTLFRTGSSLRAAAKNFEHYSGASTHAEGVLAPKPARARSPTSCAGPGLDHQRALR
jgi:hypothetical protein